MDPVSLNYLRGVWIHEGPREWRTSSWVQWNLVESPRFPRRKDYVRVTPTVVTNPRRDNSSLWYFNKVNLVSSRDIGKIGSRVPSVSLVQLNRMFSGPKKLAHGRPSYAGQPRYHSFPWGLFFPVWRKLCISSEFSLPLVLVSRLFPTHSPLFSSSLDSLWWITTKCWTHSPVGSVYPLTSEVRPPEERVFQWRSPPVPLLRTTPSRWPLGRPTVVSPTLQDIELDPPPMYPRCIYFSGGRHTNSKHLKWHSNSVSLILTFYFILLGVRTLTHPLGQEPGRVS